MFDQTPNQSSQSDSFSGQQPAGSQPAFQPQSNQEPEDIFSQTEQIKNSAVAPGASPQPTASNSPATTQPGAQASPSSTVNASPSVNEPALKSPPSVFKKINSTSGSNQSPFVNQPAPLTGAEDNVKPNKKTALLVVIAFVCVVIVASGAFWYFNRPAAKEERAFVPAETANLFDQPLKNNNSAENKSNPDSSTGNDKTKPAAKDTDGDGLTDEEEAALGTSLTSPDTDNDGLFDKEEVKVYKTDPLKADTDGDGYPDGEEVKNNFDPLKPDHQKAQTSLYKNSQYKFEFTLPMDMVFEAQQDNVVRFNDNVNQIKLYIYINNSQPKDLTPDILYTLNEDSQGNVVVADQQSLPDKTPFSTDLSTNAYHAQNGLTYLIRYVATKRAPDHPQKFVSILKSFKFIR